MSLLTFSGLAQSFGAADIFKGLSGSLPHGGKVGLVGPNGIGKTTLLLILAGLAQPTAGDAHLARGRRLGYLRQEAVEAFAARDNTVYAEMLTVFAPLQAQQARLHALEADMAAGHHTAALLEEYGDRQAAFAQAGGYDYEVRIQQTLTGLGFGRGQWELPLAHLSGGQKTRALLARLLLEAPDLLILDEPTNHLDTDAVEWLETALRQWAGGLLVVSHDRYFLDHVVDTIWEMHPHRLETYSGNYSAYLRQRQERWERHQAVFTAAKDRLTQELEYIKHGYARESTHAIAEGKLRRLSRELAAIEYLGLMGAQGLKWSETGLGSIKPLTISEAAIQIRQMTPPRAPATMRLSLEAAHEQRHARGGSHIVLRTQGLRVGYPETPLTPAPGAFTGVAAGDLALHRGECAAVLGPNGVGKTTLLRTLLGQLPALGGTVQVGPQFKVGYFAQAHEALRPGDTVLQTLNQRKPMTEEKSRAYLSAYLFSGDDLYKPIGALSGGERGRLALALLALEGANLLLLDEPTNHLDLPAQEVLQATLEAFPGTILLVSHDRYLVNRLATQVWEVSAGRLRVYQGGYDDYLEKRKLAPPEPAPARAAKPARAAARVEARP
ncbi:MAG: ABC-F family ATP-binding cassette domain-containing protein [Anaerolineales bacterium]|nr:ABC-F family ATP-binding cassette domain-containing protein [Anaerolineales bacterium]